MVFVGERTTKKVMQYSTFPLNQCLPYYSPLTGFLYFHNDLFAVRISPWWYK